MCLNDTKEVKTLDIMLIQSENISVKTIRKDTTMEKFAARLCNVFGYINATEDDVIVLKSSGWELMPSYILIDLHHVIIEFRKNDNTWTMKEI